MTESHRANNPFCRYPVFLVFGFFIVALGSCDWKKAPNEDWVVRVEDHFLSRTELQEAIPASMSKEDSAKMADIYINNWLKDHVVLVQAELNLPEEQVDFEQQLRDYRNSLIIYAFEKELIKQKLDTAVTDQEIRSYYENHSENFELKDYIVRVHFLKLPADAPKVDEVQGWMLSEDPEDLYSVEAYSKQYAEYGYFEDLRWLYLDDLLRQIPIKIGNKEQFLSENKLVKLNEGDYLYLLKIIDYQLKDGTSPLSLVQKEIRNIIVNKRKRDFILQMRQDLLKSATENNEIEYNH